MGLHHARDGLHSAISQDDGTEQGRHFNTIIDCDQPSKWAPTNVEGQAGVVHPGRPGTASALRLGQSQDSKPVASSSMEYAPAADTVSGSVLVAYDAGAGTTRTKQKMQMQWSKLALRASLPKHIRRALASVMDNRADSTVAAVRGVVATKIWVSFDGKYMWVSLTHCHAPT